MKPNPDPKDIRLAHEVDIVRKMIALYCRGMHGTPDSQLCMDCLSLAIYAAQRTERCPFGVDKPTCAKCSIHCYKTEMREQIRQVMRYAGPRMLFHHPILAVHHLLGDLGKLHER